MAAAIQIAYYVVIFSRLAIWKELKGAPHLPVPVSVVICARNESANLQKFLPQILQQDYRVYEVVVVDDHSTDDTQEVLERFFQQFAHLKIISLTGEKKLRGKREALLKGIEATAHEYLLLTDADCAPESNHWVNLMASRYVNSHTEIVLGYGAYEKRSGFLNKMIQYDTFLTALQYCSLALAGMPYMGVGRNLMYKKELFIHHNRYALQTTAGGDDDLFVNAVANGHNTAIRLLPGSATVSPPKTTWKEWLAQKRRHTAAGHHYRLVHRVVLGGFLLSMLLFHLCWPILALKYYEIHLVFGVLILKSVVQLLIYRNCMNKLRVVELWVWTPVLDFCMCYFLSSLGLLSFTKNQEWTK